MASSYTVDLIDPEVALLIMDGIMLDQAKARGDTFAVHDQVNAVTARMATMPAEDIAAAQYYYEKEARKF